mgnify:FL=1
MHDFFKKINFTNSSMLMVYLFVNSLFVLKYGIRQDIISEYILLVFYLSFVLGGLFFLEKKKIFINNLTQFRKSFLFIAILVFLVFVAVNLIVDGQTLNTDRWSALELSIRSVLNFEYPYDKLDHLGGRSSNLPGLIYIGLPFYLLGDVGLLQPFVFLLSMIVVSKFKNQNSNKLKCMFLLLCSLAFLWEVIAKSDLMTNMFIILLFMYFWNEKNKENYFQKPIKLGFLSSFLVLTRGVVAIPMTIFLFKDFVRSSVKTKILYTLSLITGSILWSFPILFSLPDLQTIKQNNPFFNQTAYASIGITVFFLLAPFLISLKVKDFRQILMASFIVISIMLVGLFLLNAFEEGWKNNLYGLFDISYLGMIIPFFLFAYLENDKYLL